MKYNEVVIDAMGGDHAPGEIVKGAAQACKESLTLKCIFVGDEKELTKVIKHEKIKKDRWKIVHASQVISMDEPPKEAVEDKPDASINVAARLIRNGVGDALISAGSTGATIIACSKEISRVAGVERGVLAAVFPAMKTKKEDPGMTIMLDVGATIHCTVNQLVSFGVMGVHYLHEIMSVKNPRVGLLNIGEEETKGHNILVETNKALRELSGINFIGNVEGKDIMQGKADVIVTEGLTGNVVLKSMEGMAEISIQTGKRIWKKNLLSKMGLAMLSPVIKKLKKRLDYSEYGGAPILGFKKLIIKAHGRSEAKAIKNAILLAEKSAGKNLAKNMEESMKKFYLGMFEGDHEPDSKSTIAEKQEQGDINKTKETAQKSRPEKPVKKRWFSHKKK